MGWLKRLLDLKNLKTLNLLPVSPAYSPQPAAQAPAATESIPPERMD